MEPFAPLGSSTHGSSGGASKGKPVAAVDALCRLLEDRLQVSRNCPLQHLLYFI